jgi:hypothetical protein
MDGMAEEYFHLGVKLYYSGKFTSDNKIPFVFRPPGYPFFIAFALRISGRMPDINADSKDPDKLGQQVQDAEIAVYLAQCVLLTLSTVILFLWLSNHLRLHNAFFLAFVFGCNPYMIILTGLLHYEILHIFLLIISSYVLACALNSSRQKGILLISAGLLWGLSTLIRPVTLILPIFTLLLFLIKYRPKWQRVLAKSAVFTLAMVAAVVPYTIRNYYLTKRIIPVNAQGSVAFWANTVRVLKTSPNHFRWWGLWNREGMVIFRSITNVSEYSYPVYMANLLELEDEFRTQAIHNFRSWPTIYFRNFIQNFMTINLDINSVFVKLFQVIQDPGKEINKRWLRVGNPQMFYSSSVANVFKVFIHVLTVCGLLGILIAIKQKDESLLVPGLVYLCICIAHSLTNMDLMYYYVKMPFLYVFAGYFTNALDRYTISVPFVKWKFHAAFICNALMIVFTIGLVIAIIV